LIAIARSHSFTGQTVWLEASEPRMANRQNSRNVILDAAESVVVEQGGSSLTLDAVAARAGVSKGGLLYNFPSKEALLEAMVARLCEHFEQEIANSRSAGGSADTLKAYVSATLGGDPKQHRVAAALLAAVANDTRLLAPMREHHRRFIAELASSGFDFARSATVWLATEGLWLLELLELLPLTATQRRALAADLLRLADERDSSGGRKRRGSTKNAAARSNSSRRRK